MTGAALVVADRFGAALSHRTWALDGAARCHLFLLLAGRVRLTVAARPAADITCPAMLWLPHRTRGALQVMAGGEGFATSVALELVQRIVGDPALNAHLRPLLEQMVLAGPGVLAPRLALLSGTFAELVEESRGRQPAAGAMGGLHLGTLLLQLWRCEGTRQPGGLRGNGATTAQRFRQLVELHYREGLRIEEFAARLCVTRAHLHDACLRATGRTPLALLHERLLAEARSRLEQTSLSVEQVGYGIGFRDPGYFNRFFKRLSGQSPGAYRRGVVATTGPAPAATSFAAWP